ncbi:symplekin, partial [Pancytospora epiphaga]
FFMNKILEKLKSNTKPILHCHIPKISFKKVPLSVVQVDLFDELLSLVTERLIKIQRQEIEKAIEVAYGNEYISDETGENSILEFYLRNIVGEQRNEAIKYIAILATDECISELLSYFIDEPEDTELFFLMLIQFNKDVYDIAASIIYTEKRYFKPTLAGSLPEVDQVRIIANTRDYNWDTLQAVLIAHPEVAEAVSSAFADGTLKVSRQGFLEKIVPLDYIFAHYLERLALNDEEVIELCDNSTCFAQRYFTMLDNEDKMLEFCKLLSKYTDDFILNFIRSNTNSSNFSLFLNMLTRAMRFTGDLRAYIVDRFAECEEFFHTLITYLDIGRIDKLLEIFYQPGLSIEALRRKYHPQELLLELHRFESVDIGVQLIEECAGMADFTDHDWVFVLKSLESVDRPIKMETCRIILDKRPQLRGQVIFLLRHSLGTYIWHSSIGVSGLIGCLELLGSDLVEILEMMSEKEVIRVLSESKEACNNLRRELGGNTQISSKYNFLRECLNKATVMYNRR